MSILYECNECKRKCKSTNQFQCSDAESIWKKSAQFKLFVIHDPVYVLDIKYPVQLHNITAAYMLKDWDGKVITINGASEDGLEKRCDQSTVWFPSRWLKQKPAKPTAEELQERIDRMVKHAENSMGVSPCAYDSIIGIATGEK